MNFIGKKPSLVRRSGASPPYFESWNNSQLSSTRRQDADSLWSIAWKALSAKSGPWLCTIVLCRCAKLHLLGSLWLLVWHSLASEAIVQQQDDSHAHFRYIRDASEWHVGCRDLNCEWAENLWQFPIRLYTPLFQLSSFSSVAQGFILAVFLGSCSRTWNVLIKHYPRTLGFSPTQKCLWQNHSHLFLYWHCLSEIVWRLFL